MLKLVEKTVRDEHHHSPKKPIYLAGESLGACLALSVSARNPHIDIVLVLSNPGKLNGLFAESFCLYACMKPTSCPPGTDLEPRFISKKYKMITKVDALNTKYECGS